MTKNYCFLWAQNGIESGTNSGPNSCLHFTGASVGPCKAFILFQYLGTILLCRLNFNHEPEELLPLITASPMPKAKLVPFTPSDSQLLWKKDPRLKRLTLSRARTAVNQYIHDLVIDLAGKPPNHAPPHHHNHPVS